MGIPGYESPADKKRRLRQEEFMRNLKEQATVTSSASSRTTDSRAQRCHICGWTGVPKLRQQCPACDGRYALSDDVPVKLFIDLDVDQADAHDHDHDDDHNHDYDCSHGQESGKFIDLDADQVSLHDPDHERVMPIEYEDCDDSDDLVMELEEEVEIHVALDTGSVAHCAGPKDIPGSVRVKPPASGKIRNFVGAGGDGIKNHGEALVQLMQENGNVINTTFQVADVVRPLHSASQICDGTDDKQHEVLFTREAAHVVPEGTLSRLLAAINVIAKYPRRGGLYVAKMKARRPRPKPSPSASRSSFTRPGRRS